MRPGDKDCYKCRKMTQWGFTGISLYLTFNSYAHGPYATKTESFLRFFPGLFFFTAAVYSYYQASLIKQQILEAARNDIISFKD